MHTVLSINRSISLSLKKYKIRYNCLFTNHKPFNTILFTDCPIEILRFSKYCIIDLSIIFPISSSSYIPATNPKRSIVLVLYLFNICTNS